MALTAMDRSALLNRTRPFCRALAVAFAAVAICGNSFNAAHAQDPIEFLNEYCVECHMEGGAEAGIVFDRYQRPEDLIGAGKHLLRALDAVDESRMPPTDALQPTVEERAAFVNWLKDSLLTGECCNDATPAPVVIRRLNRQEYDNTLRDLLGVDLRLAGDFPADDIGFGYDNIGSALNTSPVHIERYLDAAEKAMQAAIQAPNADALPPVELIGLRTYPLAADATVEFEHHLKPGRYLVDFSLVRAGLPEDVPPPRMLIGFGTDRRAITAATLQDETVVYRYWMNVFEGDAQVSVALAANQENLPVFQVASTSADVSGDKRYGNDKGLHVDSMVVHGPVPFAEQVFPPAARPVSLSLALQGDGAREEHGREIVSRFASAAFRRPATPTEVDRLMMLFKQAQDQGESFESALQITLSAALISPKFFYLVEPETDSQDRPLTEFELASRLSYFLWSSMPDETLLNAASSGTLRDNLQSHLTRMLSDPKSQAFVDNFVGQWLQLRNLPSVAPDPDAYPDFDSELVQAMESETQKYFAHVLRENRSVLELLDSDYTFLNDRLARHYAIDGVEGDDFRLVRLENRERGGVLTQASVLSLTSHHNRTSPVKRGQWILQQILGTPPPPPPPNVAQLDESPQAATVASLRDRLEVHRSSPECAACHNQMDGLGFALENFDAIGSWRDSDGQFPIDASGELPGDQHFDGAGEMKEVLRSTGARRFSWCLIENMLTYGLGRSLEPDDYCTVEAIRKRLAENDYKMQEILLAIVQSDAFQRRGGQ